MDRIEAIKLILGSWFSTYKDEALQALGVSAEEITNAHRSMHEERRARFLERMSPDWRGEEMGD